MWIDWKLKKDNEAQNERKEATSKHIKSNELYIS